VFTATGKCGGLFLKLLMRWRGSIYKLVWRDLLIYVVLYYMLSGTYRFLLTEESESHHAIQTIDFRGRLHVYDFPYESAYDLLQIGWVYDSLYDKKIKRVRTI
jgi:hypothetical protein